MADPLTSCSCPSSPEVLALLQGRLPTPKPELTLVPHYREQDFTIPLPITDKLQRNAPFLPGSQKELIPAHGEPEAEEKDEPRPLTSHSPLQAVL